MLPVMIYWVIKRKRQLEEVMPFYQGLHRSRYIRLMLLAGCEMLIAVLFSLFSLIYVFKTGLTKFSPPSATIISTCLSSQPSNGRVLRWNMNGCLVIRLLRPHLLRILGLCG
jgi:Pheromone A receptor